jgi:hypothetical protein
VSDFVSTRVLRTNASRTFRPKVRSGRFLAQNTELPRLLVGGAAVALCLLKICQKGRVDNVHTLRFGLGRTSVGLPRIADVSGGVQCLRGLECSSSPISGTAFPLVRGVFALTCGH